MNGIPILLFHRKQISELLLPSILNEQSNERTNEWASIYVYNNFIKHWHGGPITKPKDDNITGMLSIYWFVQCVQTTQQHGLIPFLFCCWVIFFTVSLFLRFFSSDYVDRFECSRAFFFYHRCKLYFFYSSLFYSLATLKIFTESGK